MAVGRPPRAAVRAAVRDCLADLEPGDRVLVALSGGADSLALAGATVVVAREIGLDCAAVVVDHQLQPESAAVAATAADQARILGIGEVHVVAVHVARGPRSGGLEAAARAARYDALTSVARGGPANRPAAAILLGHTRDDQAETVLLALARGSGTRSLAGMPARSGLHRRPLLGLSREVVARAARATAAADPRLEPWVDPHNTDTGFARVRVRRSVLPALEAALGPGVVAALDRTATLARQDAEALDGWADRVWSELGPPVQERGNWSLPVSRLTDPGGRPPPAAIGNRVVRRFLLAAGCPPGALTAEHVWAVAALLEGPETRAEVALPAGRRARREAGLLVVRA